MASRDAMLAARDRRILRFNARAEWFTRNVVRNLNIGMAARLRATGQMLRDKIVINISYPVTKVKKKRLVEDERFAPGDRMKTETYTTVDPASRSKPGEYPHADTTRLMKDVFWELQEENLLVRVGTTLDYGLWLETMMQRSFIRRTLLEMAHELGVILVSNDSRSGIELPGQE